MLAAFARDDHGVSAVEYGVLGALLSLMLFAGGGPLNNLLGLMYQQLVANVAWIK